MKLNALDEVGKLLIADIVDGNSTLTFGLVQVSTSVEFGNSWLVDRDECEDPGSDVEDACNGDIELAAARSTCEIIYDEEGNTSLRTDDSVVKGLFCSVHVNFSCILLTAVSGFTLLITRWVLYGPWCPWVGEKIWASLLGWDSKNWFVEILMKQ